MGCGCCRSSGPEEIAAKRERNDRAPYRTRNPALTWCAANVVVQMDAAENVKPSRNKSSEKIDGLVALAMGLGRVMAKSSGPAFEFAII